LRTSGWTHVAIRGRIVLRNVLPGSISRAGRGLAFPRAKPDRIVAAGSPVGGVSPDCRPIPDCAAILLCIRGGTGGGTRGVALGVALGAALTKTDIGFGGRSIAALCRPRAIVGGSGDTVAVTVVAQFPPAIAGVLRARAIEARTSASGITRTPEVTVPVMIPRA
jgi:hypothetical protein